MSLFSLGLVRNIYTYVFILGGFAGEISQKRKRGRPPKKETLARRQAEREEAEEKKAAKAKLAQNQQAEDEEDEVVDAGAIDDHEGQ